MREGDIMRIKTSNNVFTKLKLVKDFLEFDNNAQVLKLAINFSLSQPKIELPSVVEDGFEIDINVLFGDEKDYYLELLKSKFKVDEINKSHLSQVIEFGFDKMEYYINISKGSKARFVELVMEDICI